MNVFVSWTFKRLMLPDGPPDHSRREPIKLEPTCIPHFSPFFQAGLSSTIAILKEGEKAPLFGVEYHEIKARFTVQNFAHSSKSSSPDSSPADPSAFVKIVVPRGILKAIGLDSLKGLPIAHLPANSIFMFLVYLYGGVLDIPEKASSADLAMLCHVIYLFNKWRPRRSRNLIQQLRNALYRLTRADVDFSFLMKTIWIECERDSTLLDVIGRFLRRDLEHLQDAIKDLPLNNHHPDLIKFTHHVAKNLPLIDFTCDTTFHVQDLFDQLVIHPKRRKGNFTLKSAEEGSTGTLCVIPEILHALWPYFHERAVDCIPITTPPELTLPLSIGALSEIYLSLLSQGKWEADDDHPPSIEDCISILKHGATCGLFESLPKLSSSDSSRKGINPTFQALVEYCYDKAFPEADLAWQLMSCYALGWKQKEAKVAHQIANSELKVIPKELVRKAFQGILHPPETDFDDEEEEEDEEFEDTDADTEADTEANTETDAKEAEKEAKTEAPAPAAPEPAAAAPASSEPIVASPPQAQPAEPKPAEPKPASVPAAKPAEPQPTPAQPKPAEPKPAEAAPAKPAT